MAHIILEFAFSSTTTVLLPLALFILLPFIITWLRAPSKPKRNLPLSPPKFPIVGNLFQLGPFPHRTFHSLSRKYGELMMVHLGSKPVVVASSAEAAREIMKTHDLIFSNRPKMTIGDRLFYGSRDIAFAPYGEYWRQVRSIGVLQLLSSKRVQSFQFVREEETSVMIGEIMRSCGSYPVAAATINLSEILMKLTNDVICRVALGRKYSEEEDGRKAVEALKEFVEVLGTFDIGDFVPWLAWLNRFNGLNAKVEKVIKQNDEFLEGVIEKHESVTKGEAMNDDDDRSTDLVDILLQIHKDNPINAGFALQRDSLKALILDMFAAGTDTTYTVMEWAMTQVLRHPKILKKLQVEVREAAQGKLEITEDDLDKMHYLRAVIKETLRLHTPIPLLVPREPTEDVKVLGYDVPAGTRVMINAWAIARDPALWKKPEEFQPDRFLANDAIDYRGLNFELIPFGAGRRGCPGISFGMAVNKLAMAKLVHKFELALPDGLKIEDLDMSESNGLTIHRKNSLFVTATPFSY